MKRRKSGQISGARDAGYTLMELLVVIAILSLLMVVVTPQVMRQFSKAKSDTALLQIETLVSSLEIYYIDMGAYPDEDTGLAVLLADKTGSARWNGPYVRKRSSLIDPWGQPFKYKRPGTKTPYEINTLGADKAEGGEKEDRDLSSAEDAS